MGVSRGRPGALVDETAIASLVQLARDITGRYWPISEVAFVNPRPEDVTCYEDFFGCAVRFDQPRTRLVIAAGFWPCRCARPIRLCWPTWIVRRRNSWRVSAVPASVEAWRRSLVPLIREGRANLAELSAVHHTSPRSFAAAPGRAWHDVSKLAGRHPVPVGAKLFDGIVAGLGRDGLAAGVFRAKCIHASVSALDGHGPAQWRRQQLSQPQVQAA